MNNICYNFKNLSFNSGLFDSFVDMTYVLIMENSKREKNMYKELNLFKPTSKVKIQYNKGFKKCKKNLYKQQTNWDLMDATYNVILDAKNNDYKNILILEEDFIINNKEINKLENINEIKTYIQKNKIDVYLFGKFNINVSYNNNKHKICNKENHCGGTQGYIITNSGIDTLIHLYESGNYKLLEKISYGHIDWLYNSTYFKTYHYDKPLIIQPLDETENRNNTWGINYITNFYIKLFGLDDKNKYKLIKNYKLLYKYNYLLKYILLFLLFIFIYIYY